MIFILHMNSPVSGVDVLNLLGGTVTRDKYNGNIISAEATQMTWNLEKEGVRIFPFKANEDCHCDSKFCYYIENYGKLLIYDLTLLNI